MGEIFTYVIEKRERRSLAWSENLGSHSLLSVFSILGGDGLLATATDWGDRDLGVEYWGWDGINRFQSQLLDRHYRFRRLLNQGYCFHRHRQYRCHRSSHLCLTHTSLLRVGNTPRSHSPDSGAGAWRLLTSMTAILPMTMKAISPIQTTTKLILIETCYYLENQGFGGVNTRDSLIETCFCSRLYGM